MRYWAQCIWIVVHGVHSHGPEFSLFLLFICSSDLFVYYVGDYRQGPSVCMLCIDPEEPLHSKSDIITAVMMQYYFSSITILYSTMDVIGCTVEASL